MKESLTANVIINFDAAPSKVRKAVADTQLIDQYRFGTKASSDWKAGKPHDFQRR